MPQRSRAARTDLSLGDLQKRLYGRTVGRDGKRAARPAAVIDPIHRDEIGATTGPAVGEIYCRTTKSFFTLLTPFTPWAISTARRASASELTKPLN